MSFPREGGCQCGEIRYVVTAEPVRVTACFCSECQRQSGSAFGLSLTVREGDFSLTKGSPAEWMRLSDSGRPVVGYFCGTCGTRIVHRIALPGLLNVKPGTLDDTTGIVPRFAAWVRRKPDWLELKDLEASWPEQAGGADAAVHGNEG